MEASHCQHCGKPITCVAGRRARLYCDNNNRCKQRAYLRRQAFGKLRDDLRQLLDELPQESQQALEEVIRFHGVDAAERALDVVRHCFETPKVMMQMMSFVRRHTGIGGQS